MTQTHTEKAAQLRALAKGLRLNPEYVPEYDSQRRLLGIVTSDEWLAAAELELFARMLDKPAGLLFRLP